MRYSSTLIGIGMRYSLISMAVFKLGRHRVSVCVSAIAPLGRASLPKQHVQTARRGGHRYSYLREEKKEEETLIGEEA